MLKIKISQLEVLAAVVNSGSFTQAALDLGCTQSRVSQAICELERLLGRRLVERTRGGCVATDAGERVLLHARDVLALVGSLETSVAKADQLIGHIRVACFRSVATHVLPYALAALARAHPQIEVDVDDSCRYQEIEEAVRSGRVDIGIGCAPFSAALVTVPMFKDEYVLLVPDIHAMREPFGWQQLDGLDLIEPIRELEPRVLDHLSQMGLQPRPTQDKLSDGSVMAIISQGQAFSVLPRLATLPLPAGVVACPLVPPLRRDVMLIATAETARKHVAGGVLRALSAAKILAQTSAYKSGAYSI